VQRVTGNVTIENANGQVSANAIKGDVSARTSFSAADVGDVSGRVTVDNQNGGVTISVARGAGGCKSISAKTSFSSILVRLPENASYDLSAHTSFGHIKTEFPVTTTGELGSDSLRAKIGNGGCELSLNNSNGGIEILKL
jgi:DUF4097 and DUF4098 domain-containing protein YvlB